jgi:hypothetical protein
MGLIRLIEHVAEALTGSTASKVAADEVKAWSPWLAARLTKFAVNRLPEAHRERYAEEWDSHVADTPGSVGKICMAFGFLFAAYGIRRADSPPLEIQLERALFLVVVGLYIKVVPYIVMLHDKYATGSHTPRFDTFKSRIDYFQIKWSYRLLTKIVRWHS